MKFFSTFFCLLTLMCSPLLAQKPDYRNSLQLGIDHMSLDAPDAMGYRVLHKISSMLGLNVGYRFW